MANLSEKYDAIIIGGGIGGLVCGCQLAKSGMRVIIVEKNDKVGGCCVSFVRNGYTFNAAAHVIGGCRKDGSLFKVISALGIDKKLKLNRAELTDELKCPSYKIRIWKDVDRTIDELKQNFPRECKNIENFFKQVQYADPILLYSRFKNRTFQDMLDEYFYDKKLKAGLGVFLGSMGLPSSYASAITATILFREFVLDGGYYINGGMQSFVNILEKLFVTNGGKILFLKRVKNIKIVNKMVKGVFLNNGEFIESDYVISNCDAISTFSKLVNVKNMKCSFMNWLASLKPSISAFIVYLGISKELRQGVEKSYSLWYCRKDNIERIYKEWFKGKVSNFNDFLLCSCPSFYDRTLVGDKGESMMLMTGAPYKNKNFWKTNKNKFIDDLIRMAERIFGEFSSSIKTLMVATPNTIQRFTGNSGGAAYGWASIPEQNLDYETFKQHGVSNLFVVGHWALSPFGQGGINSVAQSGYSVAKHILLMKR